MSVTRRPWTYPRFTAIAREYYRSGELAEANRVAYEKGRRYGWLDKFYGPRGPDNPRRRRKDAKAMSPVPGPGQLWQHVETGNLYEVVGMGYNVVWRYLEVVYKPCYPCEYKMFTRPFTSHPRAWDTPGRFVFLRESGRKDT
jgi:hypothetical protein